MLLPLYQLLDDKKFILGLPLIFVLFGLLIIPRNNNYRLNHSIKPLVKSKRRWEGKQLSLPFLNVIIMIRVSQHQKNAVSLQMPLLRKFQPFHMDVILTIIVECAWFILHSDNLLMYVELIQ